MYIIPIEKALAEPESSGSKLLMEVDDHSQITLGGCDYDTQARKILRPLFDTFARG